MNRSLRCSLEAFRSFEYLRWREQFAFNGTDEFCGVTYPLPHKKTLRSVEAGRCVLARMQRLLEKLLQEIVQCQMPVAHRMIAHREHVQRCVFAELESGIDGKHSMVIL